MLKSFNVACPVRTAKLISSELIPESLLGEKQE